MNLEKFGRIIGNLVGLCGILADPLDRPRFEKLIERIEQKVASGDFTSPEPTRGELRKLVADILRECLGELESGVTA